MTWVLIAVAIMLAAFGPILWLRPSARDRRLTALRARGRSIGFGLDIRALPRLDPRPEERVSAGGKAREATELMAVYRWTMARRLTPFSACRCIRGPDAQGAGFSRGVIGVVADWYLDPDQPFPPTGWTWLEPILREHLPQLPADVRGVALEAKQVSIYWREGIGNEVAAVDALLTQVKALEAALQQACTAASPPPAALDSDPDSS